MTLGVIELLSFNDIINTKEKYGVSMKKLLEPYNIMGIYGIYIDKELIYIGQSKNIGERWETHKHYILKNEKKRKKYNNDYLPIYVALRKAYSEKKNIYFGILKVVYDKNSLLYEENKYINKFKPCYNIHY